MVWVTAQALFGGDGLLHWMRLRHERARVGEETMRLARETRALETRIAALGSGEHLEALAREQFGLVRADEVVYRFRRPPTPAR